MVFPIIPVALWAVLAASGSGLAWYYGLSDKEKDEANRKVIAATGRGIEWWSALPDDEKERIIAIIINIVSELFGKSIKTTDDPTVLNEDEWSLVGVTIRDRGLI
ncbi:hypothetical protein [Azospirillum sp. B510]|uniref:hypothetical protein n=1 Tax=Azospirillum sp. (strain B510) TaxID=137722 RepID=UPI0005A6167F|nr:hypothetical protein [Azospirillum sp. B510]